jgi:hypothetical protein
MPSGGRHPHNGYEMLLLVKIMPVAATFNPRVERQSARPRSAISSFGLKLT